MYASKQSACKQIHRFAAVTRGACCNLKMLSRSYLIYLTKTFGSINKIFGRVKKTIQAKTLIDLSKRVSLTEQKFGRLNQNILWNQPNTFNQTISLDETLFFSECKRWANSGFACICKEKYGSIHEATWVIRSLLGLLPLAAGSCCTFTLAVRETPFWSLV